RTLFGLDLDDVRDPQTGELQPWAQYAVATLDSYTEVSPSGRGVKAIAYGTPPRGRDHERGIEIHRQQYFCITGRRLPGTPAGVQERTAQGGRLHAEFLGDTAKPTGRAQTPGAREVALSALAGLSPARAVGYGDWLGVGMALHSVGDDGD